MPRVGFEPTRKRFLRPPPLPLGYRGVEPRTDRAEDGPALLGFNALSRIRTCITASLSRGPLPFGLPEQHPLTGLAASAASVFPVDAGGNRTLISWVQARGLPVRRRAHSTRRARSRQAQLSQRCGKGSNLQPRPSKGRALVPVELPQLLCPWSVVRGQLLKTCRPPQQLTTDNGQRTNQWSRQDSNLH